MKIQRAIDLLDTLIGMVEDNQGNDYDDALHTAIRSLEAWDDDLPEYRFVSKNGKVCSIRNWIEKGGNE